MGSRVSHRIDGRRPATRIPVTNLIGFLGAGKTTPVNRLMAQSGLDDTAVIVNASAEADLDGPLVDDVEGGAVAATTS